MDEHGHLTHSGSVMADFPISPFLSRCLISSAHDFKCSEQVLSIVSLLSVEDFFVTTRSEKKREQTDKARLKFIDSSGDHITYWNIYHQWELDNYSKDFCIRNFFHYRALSAARNVRKQLLTTMQRHHLHLHSCISKPCEKMPSSARIPVLSSLGAGFYVNTAKKHHGRPYFFPYLTSISDSTSTTKTLALYITPQSFLNTVDAGKLDWVIYNDIQYTTKVQMRVVSRIDFSMIKVLFGRVELMDVRKLCNLEPHAPKELDLEPFASESIAVPTEFVTTHEIVSELHHKEVSHDGTVISKTEIPIEVEESSETKRQQARERFLQRKKLKQ